MFPSSECLMAVLMHAGVESLWWGIYCLSGFKSVWAGAGLIKGGRGINGLKVQTNSTRSRLNTLPHFSPRLHIKAQTVWAPVSSQLAAVCNMYVFSLKNELSGGADNLAVSVNLHTITVRSGLIFTVKLLSDNSLTEVTVSCKRCSSSLLLPRLYFWLVWISLFVHQCNREQYIITGLIESLEEARSSCLSSVLGLLQCRVSFFREWK